MKSYEELINIHKDEFAFILGAGTSLFKIMKHEKYQDIFDHITISINSSILATNWFSGDYYKRYWTSNDVCSMQWSYWSNVVNSKCNKVIRNSWEKYYNILKPYENFFYEFKPRTGWEGAPRNIHELMYGSGCIEPKTEQELNDAIKEDEKGLCCISSIPSAIDLAIQMGCKKIFLLGVDHYLSGKYSHFWEYFPVNERPKIAINGFVATHRMQEAMFEENQKTYNALNKFAEKKDAKIYVCNPKSRIKAFDKIEFDDVFNLL